MSGIGVDDEICAGCFRSIDPADEVDCPRCGSPHHSVCWEQEGGCTVVGCGAEEEVRSSPVEAAARDSEPSVPVQPEPAVVDLDLGAGADEPLVDASPAAAETQKAAPIETLAPSSTEPEPTPPPEPSVAIPTPATPPLPSAPQVSEAVLAPPAPPPPPPAPAANWSPPPPRPTPTPVAATPTVAAPPPPPAVKSPTPHTPAEAEGNRVAHSAATGQPPSWLADPFRRYQLRYWNGRKWSDQVADSGVQATDPNGARGIPLQAPTSSAMAAPASWYPDPSKRFGHRYWNGRKWTDQVADNGVVAADPPTIEGV